MADRTLTIRIGADVSGLRSQLQVARQATQQWADKTQTSILSNREHLNTLATGFGVLGAGMVGAAGLAVKSFMDFDAAMSSVQAATMESAGNMELLREAALDAGAETVYSATEAAAAIENLAKAGVSTQDILEGGLSGALNLAASDNIAVADAAEIAASAMTQFGLSGRDVEHIADLLAAGAGKAQGGVLDLGQALNQSGLVASQFGLSIEEAVGTLTAFAEAGMTGSDAGTSLRTMLLRLANPAGETAEKMAELGVNAYDAGGNFIGMAALAEQLQDKLGGLTQAQRDQALAQIFGMDAIRAANILMENGREGIEGWIAAVDEQGYAAQQAGIRLDNLKGDIEGLMGALETALIQGGEGANTGLRQLVQNATAVVNAFAELPPWVQQSLTLITGGAGLALLGAAGMIKLAQGVTDARVAMQGLGISAKTASIAVAGVGIAIGVATAGLMFWATKAAEAEARADSYAEAVKNVGDALTQAAADVATNAFITGEGADWGWFQKMRTGYDSVAEALEGVGSSAAEAGLAVGGTQAEFDAYIAVLEQMRDDSPRNFLVIDELVSKLHQQRTAVADATAEQQRLDEASEALGTEQENLTGDITATTGALEDQTDALQDNIDAQREAAGIVLDLRAAENQWEAAIDAATDSLEENGKTLDVTTAKGRENRAALDELADSGWDLIDSMKQNGATQEQLQGQMQKTRDRFVALAESMGMSTEDANALADSLNLIPENIQSDYTLNGLDAAQRMINGFITRNDGRRVRMYVETVGYGGASATGPMVMRAAGGPIIGPGTGTSDSILARVSNGEHVWTAAEVRAAGGHGALYALRSAALSGKFAAGMPQYAGGGPVAAPATASVTPMVNVAAPSMDGLAIEGRIEVGRDGLMRFVDGRIKDELTRRRRAAR